MIGARALSNKSHIHGEPPQPINEADIYERPTPACLVPPGKVKAIRELDSLEQWQTEVLGRKDHLPVIVQFSSSWCRPCQVLRPVLESLVDEQHGDVLYYYVDIGKFPGLTELFKVRLAAL